MKSQALKCLLLVAALSALLAPASNAYWTPDGNAICTASDGQWLPTIVSDGSGGAIITWQDVRSSTNNDIYVQRVNALGAVQWTADGVAICTDVSDQANPTIVSDGSGGAIITWQDFRSGNSDIHAQRVNAAGVPQWTVNGVAISTDDSWDMNPTIVSDGSGGAIITWMDLRSWSSWDVYVQRVNASGAVQWVANGVAICTVANDQGYPRIASDGSGGAIITWMDYRSGMPLAYAQRVNASGAVQWTPDDGVAIAATTGFQVYPIITSDGSGGAIITWTDPGGSSADIYAQRMNAAGVPQWTEYGAAICTAAYDQGYPAIASDGSGGAIITWMDYRSGSAFDVYAQRVNTSGVPEWTADGVAICTAVGDQNAPAIVSDGSGGAIITWMDLRGSDYDMYVQRVNTSGLPQWTADGVAICTTIGDTYYPTIVSSGSGGAIITWQDLRSPSSGYDIYAQIIDSHGRAGHSSMAPDIISVLDVPHDEGGWVRLTIGRALLDSNGEPTYPIAMYNVWQRIDAPALLEAAAGERGTGVPVSAAHVTNPALVEALDAFESAGWPVKEADGRYFVQSKELLGGGILPPGTWELLGSFAACQEDQYIYRASTLADSTEASISYAVYIVSAHTTTPSLWFVSDPDSGYSVDNIPPGAPVGLVAEQSYMPAGLALSWNVNAANDLSYYAVYRGLTEDFVPTSGNRVGTPTASEYFDSGWRWNGGYYYKVSALDIHGNQSGFALLTPDDVTGNGTPKAPDASYLAQNYPNPFNPMTRIVFGLSGPAHVSLKIYDASGRLLRALVNDERRAGRYEETWDGRDSSGRVVSSGIYFYRLSAGNFESTRKMILVK